MAKKTLDILGGENYRLGAVERMHDATILLRAEHLAGAASAAGRAVEGILRAVIWKRDVDVARGRKSLDTGHDLRELFAHVRKLGLFASDEPSSREVAANVQRIARLWFNNMRFAPSKFVESKWYNLGEIRKDQTFKQATESFYSACSIVVKRCEVLCRK